MFWWIFVMLDGCVMNHTFNQFIKKILYTNLTIKGQIHTCSQISILVLLNWLFSRLASNDVLDSSFWLIISVSLNRQDLFFFFFGYLMILKNEWACCHERLWVVLLGSEWDWDVLVEMKRSERIYCTDLMILLKTISVF